jgi:hypothetical protein
VEWHTLLILGDVLANQFALNPVRALGDFGSKDAGVVAGEEDRGVGVDSDASQIGGVGGGEDSVEVTGTKVVLFYCFYQSLLLG